MLSQTKMQLWYPRKSADESGGDNNMITFQSMCKKTADGRGVDAEKNRIVRHPSPTNSDKSDGNEEVDVEFLSEDYSSRAGSFGVSDYDEEVDEKRKREDALQVSDFVDLDYWKKETICCGTIFRGIYDEILLDPRFLKPCRDRLDQCKMHISDTDVNVDII